MAFGKSSPAGGDATNPPTSDDDFGSGYGLPEDLPIAPLGVFSLRCKGPKKIDSENFQGIALEFEIVDHDSFTGEKVSLLAPKLDTVTPKKRRGAIATWRRIGDACKAMGLGVGPDCQPIDGWRATEGLECRGAVEEYNGKPSFVWGKPSAGGKFPGDLKIDGKHRDYGCGILPAE